MTYPTIVEIIRLIPARLILNGWSPIPKIPIGSAIEPKFVSATEAFSLNSARNHAAFAFAA